MKAYAKATLAGMLAALLVYWVMVSVIDREILKARVSELEAKAELLYELVQMHERYEDQLVRVSNAYERSMKGLYDRLGLVRKRGVVGRLLADIEDAVEKAHVPGGIGGP